MKIVVIGRSGRIGSELVEKLREYGHEALAASPDSGLGTLTGEGLAEALDGATSCACRQGSARAGPGERGAGPGGPDDRERRRSSCVCPASTSCRSQARRA